MSNHKKLWSKYMNEIYDTLDSLYLQPVAEKRRLTYYERIRKLSVIEMALDNIKLMSKIAKKKGDDDLVVPFVVDLEGNC